MAHLPPTIIDAINTPVQFSFKPFALNAVQLLWLQFESEIFGFNIIGDFTYIFRITITSPLIRFQRNAVVDLAFSSDIHTSQWADQ